MATRPRDNAGTLYRRDQRAKAQGWTGYGQKRYWQSRLTDDLVRRLGVQIGGEVELERAGSLLSYAANDIVNGRGGSRFPSSWQVRLLVAAGKIPAPKLRSVGEG